MSLEVSMKIFIKIHKDNPSVSQGHLDTLLITSVLKNRVRARSSTDVIRCRCTGILLSSECCTTCPWYSQAVTSMA